MTTKDPRRLYIPYLTTMCYDERARTSERSVREDMRMRIFVGNIAWTTTEDELHHLFYGYGAVESVRIMTDRETGRSRGFAFVDMPDATEAQAAIEGLNGTAHAGRPLTVNEARQREEQDGSR
jgi:cold-inducible RNA-binding protein